LIYESVSIFIIYYVEALTRNDCQSNFKLNVLDANKENERNSMCVYRASYLKAKT